MFTSAIKMKVQYKKIQILCTIALIFVLTNDVNSAEVPKDLPSNHKEPSTIPSALSLIMEARDDDDGLDLKAFETKSKSSGSSSPIDDKTVGPAITGSTANVAIVFSEPKSATTETSRKSVPEVGDRSWRNVKASSRDSYLDALTHSHLSKDPREGIVRVDAKPKITRLIRRDYTEGPVYRPGINDQYGSPSKESSNSHSTFRNDVNNGIPKNIARISYGAPPTQEPFLPTPSDAYSLPVQSSVNFDNVHAGYGSPQPSYGPPANQKNYGMPNNIYGPAPLPQNSYGPPLPQSSYGPPTNGYPSAGIPQQAYGQPLPAYGAPYAIQDYSQHLPSLPSIDLSWPFALKLNAFTLAKILLKIVLFKMIVKFIAVICLLLFIPKLEIVKKGDKDDADDGDEGRRLLTSGSTLERLNILTAFVTDSIEKYEKENKTSPNSSEVCTGFGCRLRKLITFEESWQNYVSLFNSYVAEETSNDNIQLTDHITN